MCCPASSWTPNILNAEYILRVMFLKSIVNLLNNIFIILGDFKKLKKSDEYYFQVDKELQVNNFQFPLTIAFISQSGAGTNNKIFVDKKESDFVFPFAEKPKYVVADPFTSLLFEGKITELQ